MIAWDSFLLLSSFDCLIIPFCFSVFINIEAIFPSSEPVSLYNFGSARLIALLSAFRTNTHGSAFFVANINFNVLLCLQVHPPPTNPRKPNSIYFCLSGASIGKSIVSKSNTGIATHLQQKSSPG